MGGRTSVVVRRPSQVDLTRRMGRGARDRQPGPPELLNPVVAAAVVEAA
jgi:hypothetical protein